MNQSVSLEMIFGAEQHQGDPDGGTLLNVIYDEDNDFISDICMEEDKERTLDELRDTLSRFELSVLNFYLEDHSYKQIAKLVSKEHDKRYNEKSIDNALLRIRHKASSLLEGGAAMLPLFRGRRRRKKSKTKRKGRK
jgi:hypothetical protein